MKITALTFTMFLAFGLAACGDESGKCGDTSGDNFLDGSYCGFGDLDFDTVRVTYSENANALDIRYGTSDGDDLNTKLSVIATGNIVIEEGTIPGEFLSVRAIPKGGSQLGAVTLAEDRSTVVLDEYSGVGERAKGRINLLIESGTRLLELRGGFRSTVIDLDAQFGGN